MSVLFYPDATRAEKVSVIVMSVAIAGFCLGWLIDFQPYKWFERLAWGLSLALTPVYIASIWVWPPIRVEKRTTVSKLAYSVGFAPLLCVGLFVLIANGVGFISTFTSGARETEPFEVAFKYATGGRRSGCKGGLLLRNRAHTKKAVTCLGRRAVESFDGGDVVDVVIRRSALGYSVRSVSRHER